MNDRINKFYKDFKVFFILVIVALTVKSSLVEIYAVPTGSMEDEILVGDFKPWIEIIKQKLTNNLYLLDLNKEMLAKGRERLENEKNIKYFIGNAEKLNFDSNFFDKYVISFCLRNVTE